jgi:hypothetical protein
MLSIILSGYRTLLAMSRDIVGEQRSRAALAPYWANLFWKNAFACTDFLVDPGV